MDEHLGGKTHQAGIKQIQHSLEIISIGNIYSNIQWRAQDFSFGGGGDRGKYMYLYFDLM